MQLGHQIQFDAVDAVEGIVTAEGWARNVRPRSGRRVEPGRSHVPDDKDGAIVEEDRRPRTRVWTVRGRPRVGCRVVCGRRPGPWREQQHVAVYEAHGCRPIRPRRRTCDRSPSRGRGIEHFRPVCVVQHEYSAVGEDGGWPCRRGQAVRGPPRTVGRVVDLGTSRRAITVTVPAEHEDMTVGQGGHRGRVVRVHHRTGSAPRARAWVVQLSDPRRPADPSRDKDAAIREERRDCTPTRRKQLTGGRPAIRRRVVQVGGRADQT